MKVVRLLVGKDLRVLARSPVVLVLLLAYPLVIATLIGLVAGYASSKPRVALVDLDGLPEEVAVGGRLFPVERTITRINDNVTLVRLPPDVARRQLETGKVVAVVTVPRGFVADVQAMVRSPKLTLETTRGALSERVTQQVQALVYNLNRQLQETFVASNLEYIELLQRGGSGRFFGRSFDVLGLEGTERELERVPDARLDEVREFVRIAQLALDQTDDALRATANPIELERSGTRGRSTILSAQVQAYALALTVTFLALVLAAVALTSEREENVLGRFAQNVSFGRIVLAKILLAALLAGALGLGVALAFGAVIEAGDVAGGEPWARLPLLAAGLLLAGAALGALGTVLGVLAREARTASLAAVLVVLPVVLLGLVPRSVFPAAGWISDLLPFTHAVDLFEAALFELDPWETVLREVAWLLALGAVFAGVARLWMRRLLA